MSALGADPTVFTNFHSAVLVVEGVSSTTARTGVRADWLFAVAADRLRAAGVQVLSEADVRRAGDFRPEIPPPVLSLYVDAERLPGSARHPRYVGFFRLSLLDVAVLARAPARAVPVTSWSKQGMISPDAAPGFRQGVNEILRDSVDALLALRRSATQSGNR